MARAGLIHGRSLSPLELLLVAALALAVAGTFDILFVTDSFDLLTHSENGHEH